LGKQRGKRNLLHAIKDTYLRQDAVIKRVKSQGVGGGNTNAPRRACKLAKETGFEGWGPSFSGQIARKTVLQSRRGEASTRGHALEVGRGKLVLDGPERARKNRLVRKARRGMLLKGTRCLVDGGKMIVRT